MEEIKSITVHQAVRPTFDERVEGQRLEVAQRLRGPMTELVVGDTVGVTLENVFRVGNIQREYMPRLRYSISVGDVVGVEYADGRTDYWLTAMSGFTQVECEDGEDHITVERHAA